MFSRIFSFVTCLANALLLLVMIIELLERPYQHGLWFALLVPMVTLAYLWKNRMADKELKKLQLDLKKEEIRARLRELSKQ
ncbi:MAG: hypothetical protein ACOYK8_09695 [Alphaproteobacteria bacterium]